MLSGDTTVTGITPAYAGKSSSWSTAPSWTRDHPRLCGEKKRQAETEVLQPGSPPPMRGKAVVVSCNGESYGITPAYAGKSTGLVFDTWNIVDHPRLCGEK